MTVQHKSKSDSLKPALSSLKIAKACLCRAMSMPYSVRSFEEQVRSTRFIRGQILAGHAVWYGGICQDMHNSAKYAYFFLWARLADTFCGSVQVFKKLSPLRKARNTKEKQPHLTKAKRADPNIPFGIGYKPKSHKY